MEKVLTALPWSTIFICGNKSLAMSTRVIIVRWFSLESPVVERKYFFTRFKGENYLSLTALVAGMTINNCLKLQLPMTAVHFCTKKFHFCSRT